MEDIVTGEQPGDGEHDEYLKAMGPALGAAFHALRPCNVIGGILVFFTIHERTVQVVPSRLECVLPA